MSKEQNNNETDSLNSSLLRETFKAISRLVQLAPSAYLVCGVVVLLVVMATAAGSFFFGFSLYDSSFTKYLVLVGGLAFAVFVLVPIGFGIFTKLAIESLRGHGTSVAVIVRCALRRYFSILVMLLLTVVMPIVCIRLIDDMVDRMSISSQAVLTHPSVTAGELVTFLVLALFALMEIFFVVTLPAMMAEELSVMKACRRSFNLVKSNYRSVLVAVLIGWVCVGVLPVLVSVPPPILLLWTPLFSVGLYAALLERNEPDMNTN